MNVYNVKAHNTVCYTCGRLPNTLIVCMCGTFVYCISVVVSTVNNEVTTE